MHRRRIFFIVGGFLLVCLNHLLYWHWLFFLTWGHLFIRSFFFFFEIFFLRIAFKNWSCKRDSIHPAINKNKQGKTTLNKSLCISSFIADHNPAQKMLSTSPFCHISWDNLWITFSQSFKNKKLFLAHRPDLAHRPGPTEERKKPWPRCICFLMRKMGRWEGSVLSILIFYFHFLKIFIEFIGVALVNKNI